KHHFSIYDPVSNGIFTGDTAGIRYEQLVKDGIHLFLPSTSPNHFNPNDMHASIKRIDKMNVDRIYFGHFGMTESSNNVLQQVVAEKKAYDDLSKRLLQRVKEHLRELGIPDEHEVYILINLDMQVSSLGIIDYFKKLKQ